MKPNKNIKRMSRSACCEATIDNNCCCSKCHRQIPMSDEEKKYYGIADKDRVCLQQQANFEMLSRAFNSGHVCIMDCIEKATNEHVAVICAVQPATDGSDQMEFVPFAKFFNGDPYKLLISPQEYEPA